MTDKKVQKKYPLLDQKNLEPIKNWAPWESSLDQNGDPSEAAYQKYLVAEQKLIEEQEDIHDLGFALDDTDLQLSLNKSRKHLSDAALDFSKQVDFLKWVQKTVDDAEEKNK